MCRRLSARSCTRCPLCTRICWAGFEQTRLTLGHSNCKYRLLQGSDSMRLINIHISRGGGDDEPKQEYGPPNQLESSTFTTMKLRPVRSYHTDGDSIPQKSITRKWSVSLKDEYLVLAEEGAR